ncbi:MAG: endonuclease domain-containing protein [Rhodospirillales bacterium]
MNTQVHRARTLRRNMTSPEAMLWRQLRARRLFDLKFRRQVPIGPYIVDFLCEDRGLVVEVDGDTHASQIAYDRRRDTFLNAAGFYVLRVTNRDVIHNLDGVLIRIADACGT